jgi:acetate---CoA ligase (ADP-forming)
MTSAVTTPVSASRLKTFFAPRSIAIVGASDNSGWSRNTFGNLRTGDFKGDIYAVNPRRDFVHGQKSYASLSALPEPVDLAYVLVGTDGVLPVMEDAASAGITNLAIIAAGFAEAGPDGEARQRQLTEFAREHNQIVLGPNNLGFINSSANVMAFSQPMIWPFSRGGVSLLSQSGALAVSSLDYFVARGVGMNCLVTMGNEAIVNVANTMEYLVEDPSTRVIALFVESFRQPDEFRRLAARAFQLGKPIVVCKIGRSKLGARAASAHTGGLAGDDLVIDAALRQLGVIRVDSLEDLIITAGLLDSYGVMQGPRVGIVGASGAMGVIMSDIAEREAIQLPDFAGETVDKLRAVLPPFATPQNPLDVTGFVIVDEDVFRKAQQAVLEDPNLDIVLLFAGLPKSEDDRMFPFIKNSLEKTAALIKTARPQVVLCGGIQIDYTPFSRELRARLDLPFVLPDASRGLPALARAIWWSEKRRAAQADTQERRPPVQAAEPALSARPWSEARAREYVAAADVPVVPGEVVSTADGAVSAAERLGFPVVLKVVSPSLQHKTEAGGVALNLQDAGAVRNAYDRITAAASAHVSDVEGVLVTVMRRGGVEMLVGVARDPLWGPVLAVGLGGIWVEVLRDVAYRLLPASRADVRSMLGEFRASPLLHGARGQERVDMERLTDAICGIADAALSLGEQLDTLEVNPLRVSGAEVEALDVLVTWHSSSKPALEHNPSE